jgi:hypothetical protein
VAVSVGKGVEVKVDVILAACVVVGARTVFVGTVVSTAVGGTCVGVRVQANALIRHRIKIIDFRLITVTCSPFRIIYPNEALWEFPW